MSLGGKITPLPSPSALQILPLKSKVCFLFGVVLYARQYGITLYDEVKI